MFATSFFSGRLSAFSTAMTVISADHAQPNGPAHTFRIGVFEVTNTDFATFLNDAYANLG